MARVTIEDCTVYVPSRFELVLLAAQRSKNIAGGSPIVVKRDDDKNAVVALREIGDGLISPDSLREQLINKFRKNRSIEVSEKPEDETNDVAGLKVEVKSEAKNSNDKGAELAKLYQDEESEELDK